MSYAMLFVLSLFEDGSGGETIGSSESLEECIAIAQSKPELYRTRIVNRYNDILWDSRN